MGEAPGGQATELGRLEGIHVARVSRRSDVAVLWKRLPLRSRVELMSAILLFSTVGFLADVALLNPGRPCGWWRSVQVAYAGLLAVGYAITFIRYLWFLGVVFVAQVIGVVWLRSILPGFWEPGDVVGAFPGLTARLGVDAAGILVGVVASYILFIRFLTREGVRHVRIGAEIQLASAVQAQLVPPIDRRWGRFEILAGSSLPSSEIGGDLIDFFETDGRAVLYMADVSGTWESRPAT